MASLRDEIAAKLHATPSDMPCLCLKCDGMREALAILDKHEADQPAVKIDVESLSRDIEEACQYYYGHGARGDFIDTLISAMRNNVSPKPEARAKRQWRVLCTNCYQDLHKACDAGQECTCACRIPGSEPPEPHEAREERPARTQLQQWEKFDSKAGAEVAYTLAIVEAIDALANRLERP